MNSKSVMVMEYIDGDSLSDFVEKHKNNPELLKLVCDKGIAAVCKMIFEVSFLLSVSSIDSLL